MSCGHVNDLKKECLVLFWDRRVERFIPTEIYSLTTVVRKLKTA